MERPLILVLGLMMCGCSGSEAADGNPEPIDLSTLVRQNEVFVTVGNAKPHSGPAFSTFATDPTKVREEGTLKDGEWEGLYESYFFNGQLESRINYSDREYHGPLERYYGNGDLIAKGMYEMGSRCGDWIDVGGNDEIYPPCSGN